MGLGSVYQGKQEMARKEIENMIQSVPQLDQSGITKVRCDQIVVGCQYWHKRGHDLLV